MKSRIRRESSHIGFMNALVDNCFSAKNLEDVPRAFCHNYGSLLPLSCQNELCRQWVGNCESKGEEEDDPIH
jgi:hypothetical protein